MALYRTIQLSFWSDGKILDEFTPEDKYFYLYLCTNPQTKLCGCYQLGWTQTTSQLGYTKETITRLIDRFQNVHNVIQYSEKTKEILLLNWHKYNWTTSGRFLIPLREEIVKVSNEEFSKVLKHQFNEYLSKAKNNTSLKDKEQELLEKIDFFEDSDTVYIPYAYGMDTSVTVTVNNTVNNNDSIKEIIDYLNSVLDTSYTYKSKSNNKHINARLEEGFTVEDFKKVIDKKSSEWKDDPKMAQYLRPETLFGTKFESYLNQKSPTGGQNNKHDTMSLLERIARA